MDTGHSLFVYRVLTYAPWGKRFLPNPESERPLRTGRSLASYFTVLMSRRSAYVFSVQTEAPSKGLLAKTEVGRMEKKDAALSISKPAPGWWDQNIWSVLVLTIDCTPRGKLLLCNLFWRNKQYYDELSSTGCSPLYLLKLLTRKEIKI